MKGLLPLFLGIFGTFAFSWAGLVFVPNLQIGHLDPQTDEEGGDAYPAPRSGLAERGRHVYAANGCMYCHSQQIRPDYVASDIDRTRDFEPKSKWGDRRSAPRDYIFDRPVLLGKMRMGPDLANVGNRVPVTEENAPPAGSPAPAASGSPAASPAPATSPAPANVQGAAPAVAGNAPTTPPPRATSASPAVSPAPASTTTSAPPASAQNAAPVASPAAAAELAPAVNGGLPPYSAVWHHRHLYNPRSITLDSNMPAYRFLYEKRRIVGQPSADSLSFDKGAAGAPPAGWEIVPSYDAKCLVAYLMSLDQSHPLKEVKSTTPASPPEPGKQVK